MNIECPKCGARKNFRAVQTENTGGAAIFLAGGILSYLVHRESQKNKILCEKCGFVFSPKMRIKRTWDLLILIVLFIVIMGGALYFFDSDFR